MALEGYVVIEEAVVYRAKMNEQGMWVVETLDRQNGEKFVEKGKYPTIEEAKAYIEQISKGN